MFAIPRTRRAATVALLATAALLGSATAFAQQPQLDFRWMPSVGLGTSFTIELMQRPDGKLSGAWVPMESGVRSQGQRSALRNEAGDQNVRMNYSALVQQKSPTGILSTKGVLDVEVRSRPAGGGSDGGGGDIIVFDIVDSVTRQRPAGGGGDGGGGDIIVFDIVHSVTPVATRIQIDARPNQQLEGSAAHWQWFNRPGPGEPLIATIPALMPGQTLMQTLEIRDALAPKSVPLKVGLSMAF